MKYSLSNFKLSILASALLFLSLSTCDDSGNEIGAVYSTINNQTGFAQITIDGETLTFDVSQGATYNASVGGRPTGLGYVPVVTSLRKETEAFSLSFVIPDAGNPAKDLNGTVSNGINKYYDESLQGIMNNETIIIELVKDGNTFTSISDTSDLQQTSVFEIISERIATKEEYTGLEGAHYLEANFSCQLLQMNSPTMITKEVKGNLRMFLIVP